MAALILGGGSSKPLNEIVLVAIAAICLMVSIWSGRKAQRPVLNVSWLIMAVAGTVVLQLIPVPATLLSTQPSGAAQANMLLGLHNWRPVALSPDATAYALLCLTPAFVMMWLSASLDQLERELAVMWLLGASTVMALIGFAQATDTLSISMYDVYHQTVATGLFASRNNFADLMIIVTPLTCAMLNVWRRRYGKGAAEFILHALLVIYFFATVASASRAGLVIFSLVLLLSYFFSTPLPLRLRFVVIVSPLAVLGSLLFSLLPLTGALKVLADRFSGEEDARWEIWRNSWHAARAYWPYGAGLGNFRLAYEQFEPLQSVIPLYINAAHNEYLQLVIELGVVGVLLALVATGYIIIKAITNRKNPLVVFAIVSLTGMMGHALVDYPFRMIGINLLIAFLVVLSITPPVKTSRRHQSSMVEPTGLLGTDDAVLKD